MGLVYPKMFPYYVRPQGAIRSLQAVDDMIGIALFFRKVIRQRPRGCLRSEVETQLTDFLLVMLLSPNHQS